ncbi:MAG TPA: type II secretion system protein N [Steroidobacteraceae bacterium]|nr:type II secretion system protein N [Steroidobacteraceae bacterium]
MPSWHFHGTAIFTMNIRFFIHRGLAGLRAIARRDGLLRVAPTTIALLLIAGIAVELLRTAHVAMLSPLPPAGHDAHARPGAAVRTASVQNLQRILAAHLFGAGAAIAADLPPLRDLILGGVLYTGDAGGWAFLGQKADSLAVYQVGSEIGPNTILHAVYADRVVVERNGVLQTLTLANLAGEPIGTDAPAVAVTVAGNRPDPMNIGATKSLESVMNAQPVSSRSHAGRGAGVRLFPVNGQQGMKEFLDLGLQPGDVVTAVNGAPVDGSRGGLNMLRKSSSATLTIQRDGREIQVTVRSPG